MVETLKSREQESQNVKLTTSESQKEWTEKSPNSKLNDINKKLGSIRNQTSEIKNLQNLIKSRDYREFQKVIGCTPYDGRLGKNSLRFLGNYIDKVLKTNAVISGSQSSLNGLDVGQIQNTVDTLHIQHQEQLYLAQHESLSSINYNKLFSGKEQLQQGQLGDCYLVSTINEIANTQYFDTLMRTSISCVTWKDGSKGYRVKIPFGEPSGRCIDIKEGELSKAKLRGNVGYKLIEIAFAKNKRSSKRYSPVTEQDFKNIKGGWMKEAMETLLGKQNIKFNTIGYKQRQPSLSNVSNDRKSEIKGFLKNYKPSIGNKLVSLSSLGGGDDSKSYKIEGQTMYHKHAYSLNKVITDGKGNIQKIEVKNPWNNKTKSGGNILSFSFDGFLKAFSYISCGTLKTKDFLNNKSA